MITHLRAKNFKSWADTGDLRIAPLTGFFGTNSSGKTSLLQLLLMLKQTAESSDTQQVLHLGDRNSLVDLGTFEDILHGHQINEVLEFELSFRRRYAFEYALLRRAIENKIPELKDVVLDKKDESNTITLRSGIRQQANRIFADYVAYDFDKYSFRLEKIQGNETEYQLIAKNYEFEKKKDEIRGVPRKYYGFNIKSDGFTFENTFSLSNFENIFRQEISQITYLGPLREYPQRTYLWSGASPSTVGTRGEYAIAALLAAQVEKRPLVGKIAEWLMRMGLIHSFKLEPIAPGRRDYEVRIKKTPSSAEVLITDVGFGVSQLLPVLVLCYYVPEGSIIILEQPEIHLHPSVQSDLADLLIDVVKDRKVQIIFESHSEHLLRRLQRRMAEEKITPDETALYFCSTGESASQIEELKLDEYGNIRNWPKDFFGDEMADIVAKTEAEMIRQGADPL